jgi:hypothetical protein
MPGVDTMADLLGAVTEFDTDGFELPVEEAAVEAGRRSLEESGLLLLGEVHGVLENPLVIQSLMREFGLTALALEWPADLAPQLEEFLSAGKPLDHPLWWLGDGRVTAGHLAVLQAMGPLEITLFDSGMFTGDWSQRDAEMARLVLVAADGPMLVVAGNAHTPTHPNEMGLPMGACLATARPAVRSVVIDYGVGSFYNSEPRHIRTPSAPRGLWLSEEDLVVGLPEFGEATVPHLPVDLLQERLGW